MTPERADAASAVPAVTIKVRENGPYKVTGPVRLVDHAGNDIPIPRVEPGREASIVLCRCGASGTKPFCDRSHRECGFEG